MKVTVHCPGWVLDHIRDESAITDISIRDILYYAANDPLYGRDLPAPPFQRTVTLVFTQELLDALQKAAEERKQSMSVYAEQLLRNALGLPPVDRERNDACTSLSLCPGEWAELQEIAARRGVTVSRHLRDSAIAFARERLGLDFM